MSCRCIVPQQPDKALNPPRAAPHSTPLSRYLLGEEEEEEDNTLSIVSYRIVYWMTIFAYQDAPGHDRVRSLWPYRPCKDGAFGLRFLQSSQVKV
jgi:hypothetical protein